MKHINKFILAGAIVSFILLAIVFVSCDNSTGGRGLTDPSGNGGQGSNNQGKEVFTLIGHYINNSAQPYFEVVKDSTAYEIHWSSATAFNLPGPSNEVDIVLKGLRIYDDDHYYLYESVKVEERRNGKWIEDKEFLAPAVERLTKTAIVLALDVSESLGNEFGKIKTFARDFSRVVLQNNGESQIGLVVFATEIDTLRLTNNLSKVNSFIDNASQGHYTSLYSAMLEGITMLRDPSLNNLDGKALVTFTDGANNYRSNDPDSVKNALVTPDTLPSYTIGLRGKGNLDEDILQELGFTGNYRISSTINVLEKTFAEFSRAVSEVYNITYHRNNQAISDTLSIRFTFTVSY